MTQTVLTNGEKTTRSVKSPILTYGKNLLKQNKKFIILISAMHLLGAPFVMLFVIMDLMSKPESTVDYEFTVVIAVLCLIIAFFSGIPIAMNCFRHLHDKQAVDMEISLPLNMKERFFTGYLSGLAAYLLPFIAAEIITLIELPVFRSAWLKDLHLNDYDSFSPDETLLIYPIFGELVLGGLLLMASFYTFFVLTSCFCGQKSETTGYGIAANFCIPALFLCVYLIIEKYGFGYHVSIENDSAFSVLFGMTSPLGEGVSLAAAILALIDNPGADITIPFFSLTSFGGWVVKTLLFTLICLFAAYFVYRKRRSEQTGKSFAFRSFYYFMMTILCIVIIVLFSSISMDGALLASGIISAIIYVILDSISNRGIKKLGKSFVKFGITFAGSLLIILLVRYTGFFGVMYRVPNVSDISSAEVSFSEPITNVRQNLTLTGEEALGKVTGFQKDTIDAYKKSGMKSGTDYSDSSEIGTLEIEYAFKNGSVEEREYPIYPDTVHYINELMLTEEVKQYKISLFSETVKSNFRVEANGEESIVSVGANGCDADKLVSCYTRDMRNLTKERYYGGYRAFEEYGCFISDTDGRNSIRINGFFPETAEYLSQFVSLENMYSEYFDQSNDRVRILKGYGNGEVPVRKLNALDRVSPLETISVIYLGNEDDIYGAEFDGSAGEISVSSLSEEQYDKLLEIIFCSYPAYIPSGECYIISMGGLTGYIPEEYYEFIEKNFV